MLLHYGTAICRHPGLTGLLVNCPCFQTQHLHANVCNLLGLNISTYMVITLLLVKCMFVQLRVDLHRGMYGILGNVNCRTTPHTLAESGIHAL